MKDLSPEAIDYLRSFLDYEVELHVRSGKGEEAMPEEWTELYNLTIGL